MEFSNEIYTILKKFILDFCKLNQNDKNIIKKRKLEFVNSILSEFSKKEIEKIDYLFNCLDNLRDIKKIYEEEKIRNFKHIETIIEKRQLQEYKDDIFYYTSLTIGNLINLIDCIWERESNLLICINLYIKLGYVLYNDRFNNEDYLISYIGAFIDYLNNHKIPQGDAIKIILKDFEQIEREETGLFVREKGFWEYSEECDKTGIEINNELWIRKYIADFYPFDRENCEKLIDYILKNDFSLSNSEGFNNISSIKTSVIDECIDGYFSFPNYYELQEDHLYRYEDPTQYFELAYYYSYLINKITNKKPYSIFIVTVFYKWLLINITKISNFYSELTSEELKKFLWKYSLWKYQFERPIEEREILLPFLKEPNTIVELMYDLAEKRPINKEELLEFWFYLIVAEQISFTHGKLIENHIHYINLDKNKFPSDGKFELPWIYVRYVDGKVFFYHPHHERGDNGYLPFQLNLNISKRDFHKLNDYLLWNFPPILCEAQNGRIISIDEEFACSVISSISSFYSIFDRRKNHTNNIRKLTCEDILLIFKNECQFYLKNYQLEQYPLVKVTELFVNSSENIIEETGIIFSIAETDSTVTVVYENSSLARATYLFIIDKAEYDTSIKKIKEFFSSKIINKRLNLRCSNDFFFKKDGFLRVIRIIHDDIEEWKSKINFYSKNRFLLTEEI